MTNSIPHKIHFFWAGSTLPEVEAKNLMSFVNNLPDKNWKVYLWVTDFDSLYKASYFRNVAKENFPSSLIVKNIVELFSDKTMKKLSEAYPCENTILPYEEIKKIIYRELVGLGNPVAAKDGLAPLILFAQGGYFFDLDYKAYKTIEPQQDAPHGFLVLNQGRIISALAAEKYHKFCALSLSYLISNYRFLPKVVKEKTGVMIKHFSPYFFNSQTLRDRTNQQRGQLTIQTSGSTIYQAYQEYKTSCHIKDTSFAANDKTQQLDMGITPYLKQDGNWRKRKKFSSFDDDSLLEKIPKQAELRKLFNGGRIISYSSNKMANLISDAIDNEDIDFIEKALKMGYKITSLVMEKILRKEALMMLKLIVQYDPYVLERENLTLFQLSPFFVEFQSNGKYCISPLALFLLEKGAKIIPFLFQVAFKNRNLEFAKYLVTLDPDVVNCKFLNDRSSTPLSYAMDHHLTDFESYLLNSNADIKCSAIKIKM